MNGIIAHFIEGFNEKKCSLLHIAIILGGVKNVLQFTHFHQFCFNFIGKDEVFHGLLSIIIGRQFIVKPRGEHFVIHPLVVRHQWPGFCNTPTGGLEVRLKRGLCQATQVSCLQELTQAVACPCRSLTPFLSQLLPLSLALPSHLYFIHLYIDKDKILQI